VCHDGSIVCIIPSPYSRIDARLLLTDPSSLDVGNIAADGGGRVLANGGDGTGGNVERGGRVVGAETDGRGEGTIVGPGVALSGTGGVKRLSNGDVGDGNRVDGDVLQADRREGDVSDTGVRYADEVRGAEDAVVAEVGGVEELGVVTESSVLVRRIEVHEEGDGDVLADLGRELGKEGGGAVCGTVSDVVRGVGERDGGVGAVERCAGLQADNLTGEGVLSHDGPESTVGDVVLLEVGGASYTNLLGSRDEGCVGATRLAALDRGDLVHDRDEGGIGGDGRHDDRNKLIDVKTLREFGAESHRQDGLLAAGRELAKGRSHTSGDLGERTSGGGESEDSGGSAHCDEGVKGLGGKSDE